MQLGDIPTPALLLDLDRLEANLDWMAARCRSLDVQLRPHIKTHKCVEIARMQRDRGASGLTVSTVAEARAFVEHGFDDLTWAYPVIESRIPDIAELTSRGRVGVLVDTAFAVDALARHGAAFEVWVKVDCGYHRAGVDPEHPDSLALVDRIQRATSLTFRGILSHSGHSYDARDDASRARIAEEERRIMTSFADRLLIESVVDHCEVSVGSTPSMRSVTNLEGVTETRPGNYALFDLYQAHLGTCHRKDIAISVLSTVVSSQPGGTHSIIDAGALAMSKDPGVNDPDRPCYGELVDDYASGSVRADAWITGLSQEHGKVNAHLTPGQRVRVLPNHSCVTVAQFDHMYAVRGEEVIDEFRVQRARG